MATETFGAAVANIFNPTMPSTTKAKPEISSIYTAQLEVRRNGVRVINMDTPLPENFGIQLASSYDRPFAQPLSETAGEKVGQGQNAQRAENVSRATTGITSVNKYLSGAVWSSGSTLTLTIPFAIVAYDNAYLEVTDKMKTLLQLVAPSEGAGGFLVAPGPNLNTQGVTDILPGDFTNAVNLGGDEITLNVGRFFKFTPCIITDVNCTFDSQFDAMGNPIAATINVTFEAYWTTTKEDLEKFFAVI